MPDAHSLFSASGADGWSTCYGKPAMEAGRKTSSEYADEGTAAHTLAEWVLSSRIEGNDTTAKDFLGKKITVKRDDEKTGKASSRVYTVDSEMAEHVDEYVDRFMLYTDSPGAIRMCEERMNYAAYLGVDRDLAWGTGDGLAILFNQPELEWEGRVFPAGDEAQLHDLKYGAGVQVAADGLQMRCYGGGLLEIFDLAANITRVRLVIHQPRKDHVDEIVITPAELEATLRGLRPAVPKVMAAMDLAERIRAAGKPDNVVSEALEAAGMLHPSDKACRFCDGKAVCSALAKDVAETLSGKRISPDDFEDLTVDSPAEARSSGANYLTAAYAKFGLIETWMKAIRAELDHRILNKGEKFDGLKVVQGKMGNRKYSDMGEVEALVRTLPKPIQELMFARTLKTPAQMEKALKTSPTTWARLNAFIVRSEGAPSVVPTDDRRKPISHQALRDQFEDLTQEQPEPGRRAASGQERHPFR